MLPLSLFIAAFSGQYLGIFWTILGLFLDKFWTDFVKTGRRQQRITLPCMPEIFLTNFGQNLKIIWTIFGQTFGQSVDRI